MSIVEKWDQVLSESCKSQARPVVRKGMVCGRPEMRCIGAWQAWSVVVRSDGVFNCCIQVRLLRHTPTVGEPETRTGSREAKR
jgi:hypothetical protein